MLLSIQYCRIYLKYKSCLLGGKPSMKIGIIDADLLDNGTRHPNLALMKISGYYKELENDVRLIESYDEDLKSYDKLFMSKVFSFTNVPQWVLDLKNIEIGGTGFFFEKAPDLPCEIEHHMPDYTLYLDYVNKKIESGHSRTKYADYLDYSIGFTTRGCFRKCEFCVNKKYDYAFRHSPVTEFYDETKPYIYLWDDNILAYPRWNEVLDELEATGKPFQFRQGIDLRLMTDEKAKRFTSAKYQGDFIFAFDHLYDRDKIIDNVQLWKRYSSKVCKMYVLSAFESQDENNIADVFERIKILMKYGSLPYIMRHENYKNSKYKSMYIELARWCNQPQFFKKKSFREFCKANQDYKKDQSTNCSAYQAMIDFEKEHPEIAQKYFDLRFEEENIYKTQYGFGRKYANKTSCKNCKRCKNTWEELINDETRHIELIEKYFSKEIDLQCLKYENSECGDNPIIFAKQLVHILLSVSVADIINVIKNISDREDVTAENIPQFSDLATAMYLVPKVLNESNLPITYAEMGRAILGGDKNDIADKKYGENHGKLAALLDLAVVSKDSVSATIYKSVLGEVFCTLSSQEKDDLLTRLCLRIPIVQNAICSNNEELSIQNDMSILSATTRTRRMSNVKDLINFVKQQ